MQICVIVFLLFCVSRCCSIPMHIRLYDEDVSPINPADSSFESLSRDQDETHERIHVPKEQEDRIKVAGFMKGPSPKLCRKLCRHSSPPSCRCAERGIGHWS